MEVPDIISKQKFQEYTNRKKRQKELKRFQPPAMDMALCVTEVGAKPRQMHVLTRGNAHAKADPVEPGFLPPEPTVRVSRRSGSRGPQWCRHGFVSWLSDPERLQPSSPFHR